ncbi:MAG: cell surface protein, partial [Planctomycetes bacterium]|nr:cell surface protein [Planctomycetota bacterium]
AAGTYTVSLTATGPGGSNTNTKLGYITAIEPAPVAEFSGTPTSGLAPLSVAFTDLSTGAVTGWAWTFGDAGTSSLQNPSHTYAAAGTYTVSLTATGPGGSNTNTKIGYITAIEPAPVAEFSGAPTSGFAPLSVAFTDLSTGAVTGWAWTFGDSATSSVQNPSHTYVAAGTFTVSLTATGPGGSNTNTKVGYITAVEPAPVAEFSGTPTSGVAPLSVAFSDLSTGIVTSWAWTFGDTGTSALQNPNHTYTAAGTYTVTLNVTGPGGIDTNTKIGYITAIEPAPVAEFSGTPTSGLAPLNVAFTDLSTGAVTSWAWSFGDTGTSTLQNPSHTYAAAGTYTVSLIATGPGGSNTNTKLGYITAIEPAPVAEFSGTPTSGLAPLSAAFTDLSIGAVTSWTWTFGDAGTSSAQNPIHTYAAAGTYTVSLTATGPGGTDSITKVDYITVIAATVADFSASPTSGTGPLTVTFTDATTPSATAWSWNFGDTNTSTLQNPTNTYATPGTYTVTLVANGPGGSDTEIKTDHILVNQPATSTYRNGSGVNPPCYTAAPPVFGTTWTAGVDSSLLPGALATIVFGRSEPISPINTVYGQLLIDPGSNFLFDSIRVSSGGVDIHTFPLPNNPALVGRTASTQGMVFVNGMNAQFCNAADLVVGYAPQVPTPAADFSATPVSGTVPLAVSFSDASTGSITNWTWNFGDGNGSTLQNPNHTYAAVGTYTVALLVEGPHGYDSEIKVGHITVASSMVYAPARTGSRSTPQQGSETNAPENR